MAGQTAVVNWLLDGDPSIRWQVMRDLTHEPGEAVAGGRAWPSRGGAPNCSRVRRPTVTGTTNRRTGG